MARRLDAALIEAMRVRGDVARIRGVYTQMYIPDAERLAVVRVDETTADPTWNIEIVNAPWPEVRECFIHRDYHPVNVLWQDSQVNGIVDWPNACRGPAGIDVAWCRVNLRSTHGVAIADRFLDLYCAAAGSSVPPSGSRSAPVR